MSIFSILKNIFHTYRSQIRYDLKEINFKFQPKVNSIFDDSLNTPYCKREILNYIRKYTTNYFKINALLKTNSVTIYLVPFIEFDEIQFIETFLARIFIFLEFLKIKNENIKIFLYATPFEKKIPSNKLSLDVGEINSACAVSYGNEKYISIFRFEEANKLIIHELMHDLDLDLTVNIDKYLKNNYNINGHCSSRETYAELIGVIFNAMFVSLETNQSFKNLFEIERAFCLCQINKIYKFFNIFSTNDYHKFKSDTNLFTYYIVKGAILYNENILEIIQKLSQQPQPLRFKPEWNDWFAKLAIKSINELDHLTEMDACNDITHPHLKCTMRMTIL